MIDETISIPLLNLNNKEINILSTLFLKFDRTYLFIFAGKRRTLSN